MALNWIGVWAKKDLEDVGITEIIDPVQFRVSLLGPFKFERVGHPVNSDSWPRPKTQLLFKFLVHQRGKIFSQDQLIDAVFPELDASSAPKNLYNRISELRKFLEPEMKRGNESQYVLRPAPGSYQLTESSQIWIDTEVFHRHWENAQKLISQERYDEATQELEHACVLLLGDFLAEDLYEEWTQLPRDRWRNLALEARIALSNCYEKMGEFKQAADVLKMIIQLSPAHELAYRQLMKVYYFDGEPQASERAFQECVDAMAEHLGVEPDAESRKVLEQIKSGTLERPVNFVRHNLPNPITNFVGREDELARLQDAFVRTPLLSLTGVGGSGKTRLAASFAKKLLSQFPDGIWWLEMAPLTEPGLLVPELMSLMGIQERSGESLIETLVSYLRPKKSLLIFDNCEHLIKAAAQVVEQLLTDCDDLKVIATSREPLGITGEIVWPVLPLSAPDPRKLGGLEDWEQSEAIALFLDRAVVARSGFRLTDENLNAVAEICYRLDGIPLAIELAAARLKVLTPEQILKLLEDRFKTLSQNGRETLQRHRALQAAMDWSFELLEVEEQEMLAWLSVFSGSFSIDAVQDIFSVDLLDSSEILDLLSRLVDRSLILIEQAEDEIRYKLLETVKEYGREKMPAMRREIDLYGRHSEYYLCLARLAEPHMKTELEPDWLDRIEIEHDNFRAALRWSLRDEEGNPETGLEICAILWRLWFQRGYRTEGRKWLEEALERNPELEPSRSEALVRYGLALILQPKLEFSLAEEHLRVALEIATVIDDSALLGLVNLGLGSLNLRVRNYDEAQEFFENASSSFRTADDRNGQCMVLMNLGTISHLKHDLERAIEKYNEALDLTKRFPNPDLQVSLLNNIGFCYAGMGAYEAALESHNAALTLAIELGNSSHLATAYQNCGIDCESLAVGSNPRLIVGPCGDRDLLEKALGYHNRTLRIFRDHGNEQGVSTPHYNLGSVYLCLGDSSESISNLTKCLEVSREIGLPVRIMHTMAALARAYVQAENLDEAVLISEEMMSYLEVSPKEVSQIEEIHFARYIVLEAIDQKDESSQHLEEAYLLVKAASNRISDQTLREDYLRANATIVACWEQRHIT